MRARYTEDSRVVAWEPFHRRNLELVLPVSRSVQCQTHQPLRVDSRTQTSVKITADAGLQTLPPFRASVGSQTGGSLEVAAMAGGWRKAQTQPIALELATNRWIQKLSEPRSPPPPVSPTSVTFICGPPNMDSLAATQQFDVGEYLDASATMRTGGGQNTWRVVEQAPMPPMGIENLRVVEQSPVGVETLLPSPRLQLAETLPSDAPAGSLAFNWDDGTTSHLAATRVELQVWAASPSDVARLTTVFGGDSVQVRGLGSSAVAIISGPRILCGDEVSLGVIDLQARELLMHKVIPAHVDSQAPALLLVDGLAPLIPVVLRVRLIGGKAALGAWGPPFLIVPLGRALAAWDTKGGANITAALRLALDSVVEAPRDLSDMSVRAWH